MSIYAKNIRRGTPRFYIGQTKDLSKRYESPEYKYIGNCPNNDDKKYEGIWQDLHAYTLLVARRFDSSSFPNIKELSGRYRSILDHELSSKMVGAKCNSPEAERQFRDVYAEPLSNLKTCLRQKYANVICKYELDKYRNTSLYEEMILDTWVVMVDYYGVQADDVNTVNEYDFPPATIELESPIKNRQVNSIITDTICADDELHSLYVRLLDLLIANKSHNGGSPHTIDALKRFQEKGYKILGQEKQIFRNCITSKNSLVSLFSFCKQDRNRYSDKNTIKDWLQNSIKKLHCLTSSDTISPKITKQPPRQGNTSIHKQILKPITVVHRQEFISKLRCMENYLRTTNANMINKICYGLENTVGYDPWEEEPKWPEFVSSQIFPGETRAKRGSDLDKLSVDYLLLQKECEINNDNREGILEEWLSDKDIDSPPFDKGKDQLEPGVYEKHKRGVSQLEIQLEIRSLIAERFEYSTSEFRERLSQDPIVLNKYGMEGPEAVINMIKKQIDKEEREFTLPATSCLQ